LCQPRVIVKMIMEKQVECRLARETEVLGESLPQRHFCPSQNPTWPDPGLNPGRRGGKPATNRLSYGAAHINHIQHDVTLQLDMENFTVVSTSKSHTEKEDVKHKTSEATYRAAIWSKNSCIITAGFL
jgi:hypothetical protein